jgi:hypothetical protein
MQEGHVSQKCSLIQAIHSFIHCYLMDRQSECTWSLGSDNVQLAWSISTPTLSCIHIPFSFTLYTSRYAMIKYITLTAMSINTACWHGIAFSLHTLIITKWYQQSWQICFKVNQNVIIGEVWLTSIDNMTTINVDWWKMDWCRRVTCWSCCIEWRKCAFPNSCANL